MIDEKKIPTEDDPKVEIPEGTQLDQGAVDKLMAQLEAANAADPEALQGKLNASQEVGRMGQLLGEERNRSADLQTQLNQAMNSKQQNPELDLDNIGEGQTVDLAKAIEAGVEKVWTKKEQQAAQIQSYQHAQWSEIHNDEDYKMVKEVWETKLQNPQFAADIQSGRLHPIREYNKTVRTFYKGIAKQSKDVIAQLQGGPIPPPHVEVGERSPNLVSGAPAKESGALKKINELREKAKTKLLSEDEELELATLPFLT